MRPLLRKREDYKEDENLNVILKDILYGVSKDNYEQNMNSLKSIINFGRGELND